MFPKMGMYMEHVKKFIVLVTLEHSKPVIVTGF